MSSGPVIDYGTKARKNIAAVASLALGLMLFVPLLTGIAAVVFGRRGMRAAREEPVGGYRLARAGLLLGVVNIVVTLAVVTAVCIRAYHAARMERCANNLKQIGIAMLLYSNGHRGKLPPTFDELVTSGELPKGSPAFTCPECPGAPPGRAATVGAIVTSDYIMGPPWDSTPKDLRQFGDYPTNLIRGYEPLTNHNGRGSHVLLSTGEVKWLDQPLAAKIIAELQRGQNPPPSWKW